jgi:hypothetical protein
LFFCLLDTSLSNVLLVVWLLVFGKEGKNCLICTDPCSVHIWMLNGECMINHLERSTLYFFIIFFFKFYFIWLPNIFEIGSHFCFLGLLWTSTLLISVSWVARIAGLNPICYVFLIQLLKNKNWTRHWWLTPVRKRSGGFLF